MATLERKPNPTSVAVEPTSIQPGGGFCANLELTWGRVRRAWLRRFRPGYVRRMASLREGDCPGCPHDIVDARDLKFYRNVCGFRFAGQDPCGRISGVPLARAGFAEVAVFGLSFLMAAILFVLAATFIHWAFWAPGAVALALAAFVVSFFRDPERAIPTDPDVLVSPADGTITHLEEVEDRDFPGGRAFRVSIFLSVFNVHVNRMPRSGVVTAVRYFPGCFLDARHHECAVRNEQLWLDLKEADSGRLLRVKQISGAIARRIVCWVRPDEVVRAGDRFGMIKFGSRTEVLFATEEMFEVSAKVGDKVKGGKSVLLRFVSSAHA